MSLVNVYPVYQRVIIYLLLSITFDGGYKLKIVRRAYEIYGEGGRDKWTDDTWYNCQSEQTYERTPPQTSSFLGKFFISWFSILIFIMGEKPSKSKRGALTTEVIFCKYYEKLLSQFEKLDRPEVITSEILALRK